MNEGALLDVTGETRVFFVVGSPIHQVRSTRLYNRLCSERDIDAVFVPVQFSADDFHVAISALRLFPNLAGLIATIPHKARILDVVDEASPTARIVGGINTIRIEPDGRWIGEIFDGIGLVEAFRKCGHILHGKSVYLVGAGGAGSAIAVALAQVGVARLQLYDFQADRAERVAAIASKLGCSVGTGQCALDNVDIIINASPTGMAHDDPMPVDINQLRPEHVVADMIMKPPLTALLETASGLGCKIVAGKDALIGQAEANMKFFQLKPRKP